MKRQDCIKRIMVHVGIICTIAYGIFVILDWYNPYMNFTGYGSVILYVLCLDLILLIVLRIRRKNFILLLLTVLILGAGLWAADYFLIPKVERTGIAAPVEKQTWESAEPEPVKTEDVQAGTGSEDDPEGTTLIGTAEGRNRITVTKTVTGEGDEKITYFVADIQVEDAKEIKSCFAQDAYGENIYEKTSSMAERCQAVLAVNGDYYGWRSDGIEIRNGELFRDRPARQGLALWEDGSVECFDEKQYKGQDLLDRGAWNTFSFGPELVHQGQAVEGLDADLHVDLSNIQKKNPRTAIGWLEENHFLLVVVDGRQPGYSRGMRLPELAKLMEELGCQEAYNLDGGASSTMYFMGEIVNHPCDMNGERYVSDCIFVN